MHTRDPRPKPNAPVGGGFLFVLALLAGIVIGVVKNQVTLGFLGGAAVGAAILVALWVLRRDRT